MQEVSKWFYELITILRLSDKFGSFGLDLIIDATSQYYKKEYTPQEAAQFIIRDLTDPGSPKLFPESWPEPPEHEALSWPEENYLPIVDLKVDVKDPEHERTK
jgi:hypothetical protein